MAADGFSWVITLIGSWGTESGTSSGASSTLGVRGCTHDDDDDGRGGGGELATSRCGGATDMRGGLTMVPDILAELGRYMSVRFFQSISGLTQGIPKII
jgi:hypothetical protein